MPPTIQFPFSSSATARIQPTLSVSSRSTNAVFITAFSTSLATPLSMLPVPMATPHHQLRFGSFSASSLSPKFIDLQWSVAPSNVDALMDNSSFSFLIIGNETLPVGGDTSTHISMRIISGQMRNAVIGPYTQGSEVKVDIAICKPLYSLGSATKCNNESNARRTLTVVLPGSKHAYANYISTTMI